MGTSPQNERYLCGWLFSIVRIVWDWGRCFSTTYSFTGNELWVPYFQLVAKQADKEWWRSTSLKQKKFLQLHWSAMWWSEGFNSGKLYAQRVSNEQWVILWTSLEPFETCNKVKHHALLSCSILLFLLLQNIFVFC